MPQVHKLFFAASLGIFVAWGLDTLLGASIPEPHRSWARVAATLVCSYGALRLLTHAKAADSPGRPYLLDTSVAIDGRIADVAETGLLTAPLLVPQFVVAELQAIADGDDKQRRTRGRRGLDVLNRLRANPQVRLIVDETELPTFAGRSVDERLVLLARHLQGRVLTNDFNLNKVAQLQGVNVVNLNDLAKALRPVCLPGERMTLQIAKPGEQAGQGIGYLDDGTMVVVEGGREHVGCSATIVVTSVTQSSAGRMVFGRFEAISDL